MVVVSAAGQGTDVKVKVKTINKDMYKYMYLRVLTKKRLNVKKKNQIISQKFKNEIYILFAYL